MNDVLKLEVTYEGKKPYPFRLDKVMPNGTRIRVLDESGFYVLNFKELRRLIKREVRIANSPKCCRCCR